MNAKRLALSPIAPCPSYADLNVELLLFQRPTAPAPSDDMSDIEDISEDSSESDTSIYNPAHEASLDEGLESLSLMADASSSSFPTTDPITIESKSCPLPSAVSSSIKVENSRLLERANAWIDEYERIRRTPQQNPQASPSTSSDSAPPYKKSRATPAHLRAYYLWHECDNDVPVIADILRDPPLSLGTVVGYICTAICEENLPRDMVKVAQLDKYGHIFMKEHQRLVANAQKGTSVTSMKSAI